MVALADDRDTREKYEGWAAEFAHVAASSTQFYKGGILVLDQADGLLKKGVTGTGLIALGVSLERYLTGAGNTRKIRVKNGIHGPFANSAAADAIATDDIGKDCFIVDDQTVALTNGSSTRSRAGKVAEVDSDGVWVSFTNPIAT
jgi:hypothetical protein